MQKHRASRACDTCKRRKIRCTGKLPCAHCIKNNRTCEFKAPYTRGALPEVKSAPVEEQEKYLEEVGYKRRQNWRSSPEDERPFTHRQSDTSINTSNSPFLAPHERVQHNLNTKSDLQKNPVFAYGDPPLQEVDSSFLVLPSKDTAQALINKYFNVVAATNKVLHQPTAEKWSHELLSNFMDMRPSAEKNSQRAVVLMVFASAHKYMSDESQESEPDSSFFYFQAAERHLARETGEIRIATLQARFLQCMYLLSRARINQSYSVFGTLVNFVFSLGIHRERTPSSKPDLLELEMQKRVFWTTYVLDKYLSSALGRPQMFHDEDIDQQLPFMVDENSLSPSFLQIMTEDLSCPMEGAIYQIKLSQIVSKVLRKLYTIQKIPLETRLSSAKKLKLEFQNWRLEIAHFLDLDPSTLPSLYQRQSLALRLSYCHALLILYRPFLLDSVDESDNNALILRANLEGNVRACLDAALEVIKIMDNMYQAEKAFNASWFSHFCAYTAIVVIFVHVIRHCTAIPTSPPTQSFSAPTSNPPRWKPYFEAAIRCQEQIKSSTEEAKESFAKKCSVVLEEMRAEAIDKIRQINPLETSNRIPGREDSSTVTDIERSPMEEVNSAAHPMVNAAGFFDGEWNEINFDQPAAGEVYSVFNGLDGIRSGDGGSLVDVIDRWGFSSLTGY